MADYRCYFLNDQRHIVGVEELGGCADDNEARKIAMTLLNDRPHYSGVAVWERSRKVFEELIARTA
jgi:hypothetical protein